MIVDLRGQESRIKSTVSMTNIDNGQIRGQTRIMLSHCVNLTTEAVLAAPAGRNQQNII